MKSIIYKAEDRGKTDISWLKSWHSFSFSNYYDSDKIGFGMLRVLNDDYFDPGSGFGMHPHNNMEIITIILDGSLEHKDSIGSGSVIKKNEVQVMSAGSGILHSEFNPSANEVVNLFQIWIIPKERNIKPGYDQKYFTPEERKNKLQTIVSGLKEDGTLYIHQDAAISLSSLEKNKEISYKLKFPSNGIYLMVIEGNISFNNTNLNERDAAGITDISELSVKAESDAKILLIEIPMDQN